MVLGGVNLEQTPAAVYGEHGTGVGQTDVPFQHWSVLSAGAGARTHAQPHTPAGGEQASRGCQHAACHQGAERDGATAFTTPHGARVPCIGSLAHSDQGTEQGQPAAV